MNLFNQKFIKKQILVAPHPDVARVQALTDWAQSITSGRVASLKETALHGEFLALMMKAFGYRGPIGNESYSITQEQAIIQGAVDLALGRFSDQERKILAPFELKGADTKNLDAIMPGRAKTPVDQVWEYAVNNPGTQWVLISNYLELRLYSYADGRQAYEPFNLAKLHEPDEYARAQLLLSAESVLGGRTAELLAESKRENKEITERLYADYKILRSELIREVRRGNAAIDPLEAIRIGQKILDRVLFIAFAEDTGLLPSRILERAFESQNAFAPNAVWDNFVGLFRAIDAGSPPLKVPRYNGGLFASDALIEALEVPDHICAGFKRLAEYDFASEVSVTVLGHIFEQSIADVEQLQAEALGQIVEPKKASGTTGRRKRDGVVYTPDYIARFIVDRTLGSHAREIFEALLRQHAQRGASADDDPISWKSRGAEKAFWHQYRDRLAKLRIVDPACGSGVFLVMAFDWLKAELMRCNTRLEALGEGALFEPDSEILTHNLFGVDVNEESVEITKLSLWIKTARHGKVLDSLDRNFRVGDSLIEDSNYAYRDHGFVWKEAFKEVFAEGGFDVVLGNPPYVRQERISASKPYLSQRYEVAHGAVDLYAYFFERGQRLLKSGGRLGFITSATFFKTGSATRLRDFLRTKVTIETAVDFGDVQAFDGVTTYPTILTFKNEPPVDESEFGFSILAADPGERFASAYAESAVSYPQGSLTSESWELEDASFRRLRTKLRAGKPTLAEVVGPPLYGIKTGRNEVFVIDRKTRDALILESPSAAEIVRPIKIGDDLERWCSDLRDEFLICTHQGIDISKYPSVLSYLEKHRGDLEPKPATWKPKIAGEKWRGRKSGSYSWYELQDTVKYHARFAEKSFIPNSLRGRKFSLDTSGSYLNNKAFFFPGSDFFLLALLNSTTIWFLLKGLSAAQRGGEWRLELRRQYMEKLPIPPTTDCEKARLAVLGRKAHRLAQERHRVQQEVLRRIPDLAPAGSSRKPSEKLKAWWGLPDFPTFQAEVRRTFRTEVPLRDRNEWETWIGERRSEVQSLTAKIVKVESEINSKVYKLFNLTPEEIGLLEQRV